MVVEEASILVDEEEEAFVAGKLAFVAFLL
jgi:hypothetical protein